MCLNNSQPQKLNLKQDYSHQQKHPKQNHHINKINNNNNKMYLIKKHGNQLYSLKLVKSSNSLIVNHYNNLKKLTQKKSKQNISKQRIL